MLTLLGMISFSYAETNCSIPIPQSMFDSKLNDIESALKARDLPQMTQKIEQTTLSISCLAQPLTQIQASRYHMLGGIYHFVQKDQDKAQIYFSSARAANPTASISTEFFPEGHMIHALYNNAPEVNDGDPVEPPLKGDLKFDGLSQGERPLYRPTIFQHVAGGKALVTAVLEPGDSMPTYQTESSSAEENTAKSDKKSSTGAGKVPSPAEAAADATAPNAIADATALAGAWTKKDTIMASSGGASLAVGALVMLVSNDLKTYSAYRSLSSAASKGNEPNNSDVSTFDAFCSEQGNYSGSFFDATDEQVSECAKGLQSAATNDALLSAALMVTGASLLTVTFVF